jgi:hypothetical protein
MGFEKSFPPLLCLNMHGNFQLKKSLVYQLVLIVSRNTWHITIIVEKWHEMYVKCQFQKYQYIAH